MASQRIRVYAWEFPVRLTHWVNVLSIITLSATGVYIGAPFLHAVRTDQFIMGTVRTVHFSAAHFLLASLVVRLYWAFMGNEYASWRVWFPFTSRRFGNVVDAVKFYSLMSRKPPYAVGHTALAGFAYFLVFLLLGFMVASGFALYRLALPSHAIVSTVLGGWLLGMMDISTLRLYHHLGMYAIMFFVFIHLYIGWWDDAAERNGLMGSIFAGYKFVTGKERE
jgi:Ni/Fe-hydrogenase 1 B-type cytochrome subunit